MRLSVRIPSLLLGAALLLSAAGACQKASKPGEGGQGGGQNPPAPTGPYFKADLPDEYVLNRDPGAVSWIVDTNIPDWTVESDEAWCKATAKTNEVWLDIEEFDAREENGAYKYDPPRTCTVTVKAGAVYNKTFKIIQQTNTIISFPEAVANILTVELPADGGTAEVLVWSNAYHWTPTTDASWLTVTRKDAATLKVTSTPRSDGETEARSTKVIVYVTSDEFVDNQFTVVDAPARVGGEGYDYGDHTDWD